MNSQPPSTHIIFGIPKLPARYATVVMPVLLSVLITFIVSLISTGGWLYLVECESA